MDIREIGNHRENFHTGVDKPQRTQGGDGSSNESTEEGKYLWVSLLES